MTSKEGREEAVKRVSQCILQDRNASYGDPEDNFREIAEMWTTAGFNADPSDVSILMILMKMARIKTNPGHLDSWIDVAGYALCQAGMLIRHDAHNQYATVPSSAPQESTAASSASSLQTAQTAQELQQHAQALASLVRTEHTHKTL